MREEHQRLYGERRKVKREKSRRGLLLPPLHDDDADPDMSPSEKLKTALAESKKAPAAATLTIGRAAPPVGELFRVSLLDQGRPADAGRRAPAVGARRPLLSAAPLATAADHSARRAWEHKPDRQSDAPVRPLSSRLAVHLRGRPAGSRRPGRPMFAAWLGAVTMEITGLMPVRG